MSLLGGETKPSDLSMVSNSKHGYYLRPFAPFVAMHLFRRSLLFLCFALEREIWRFPLLEVPNILMMLMFAG